jgi:hypothetical protein
MAEEIAAADCGIAIIFDHCWRFGRLMCNSASTEQKQRIIPEFVNEHRFIVGTMATEQNRGGTDNALKYDGNVMERTRPATVNTTSSTAATLRLE